MDEERARKTLLSTLTVDMLDALDCLCPERCADPDDTDREVWMKSGERRLINRLRFMLESEITTQRSSLPKVLRN